ncbi:MAG: hypothetical protein CL485_07900 [Acidobacteria bacterium]|nr:hypothetical protein [Acidobacteriota bacterium]MBO07145.1 hypothetical protein [Acidobacteriota bacterium]
MQICYVGQHVAGDDDVPLAVLGEHLTRNFLAEEIYTRRNSSCICLLRNVARWVYAQYFAATRLEFFEHRAVITGDLEDRGHFRVARTD